MKKLKRVVIKEELVELTGSYKLALVLNQFLYWTERVGFQKYKKFEQEETERSIGEVDDLQGGWIYKTSKELSEELMLDISDTTVRRYINDLESKGYLIERRNPRVKFDQTKQYRILLLEVKNDLEAIGYPLQGYKYSDKAFGCTNQHNEDSNSNNEDSNSNNGVSNSNNVDTIPEITTEITTENTINNQAWLISLLESEWKRPTSKYQFETIEGYIEDGLPQEVVEEAIKLSADKKRSFGYCKGILSNCLADGVTSISDMNKKNNYQDENKEICKDF